MTPNGQNFAEYEGNVSPHFEQILHGWVNERDAPQRGLPVRDDFPRLVRGPPASCATRDSNDFVTTIATTRRIACERD